MSKFTWLIDSGHGGMINGIYQTAPAKMYKYDDGFVIHEGVFNRLVTKRLCELLEDAGIDYDIITPENKDVSLKTRVDRADEIYSINKNAIFVSIHGNAGGGTGYEIYTSKGETRSDKVSEFFYDAFEQTFPDWTKRTDLSDGDRDKEAQFYVLRKTDCPAILTESGFMDKRQDAEFMMSAEGVEKIANAHFLGIQHCEKHLRF